MQHGYNKQSLVYTQDDKLRVTFNGVSCKIGSMDEHYMMRLKRGRIRCILIMM
jgi:hypothetical protein